MNKEEELFYRSKIELALPLRKSYSGIELITEIINLIYSTKEILEEEGSTLDNMTMGDWVKCITGYIAAIYMKEELADEENPQ